MKANILAALMLCVPTLAFAAPPPTGSLDDQLLSPYSKDIEQAMPDKDTPNGGCYSHYIHSVSCCTNADGAAVDARQTEAGWDVKIRDSKRFPNAPAGWFKVPSKAILHCWRNPTGIPLIWMNPAGTVRCFAPPNLG